MAFVCVKYECRAPAETTELSMADMYDLTLEQIAWIDAQGYPVTINFCEHHGSDDGYLPSPGVLAAAAARITRNVRLQVNVLVPFSDPLRVAEDVAVLDHLSRGRAEVLLLGGYVSSEMAMFGVDPKQRGALMDEGVQTLKQAWSGQTFEFRGRSARITPRYQAEMAHSFLYVSETPEQDWERLAPCTLYETNCYARWQSSTDLDMLFSSAMDAEALKTLGIYQVVRPETVLAKAPSLARNDAYILHPLVGGLDADTSWRTLRNFFDKVAPKVAINPL